MSEPCETIALNAKFGDLSRPFLLAKLIRSFKPDIVFADMFPQSVSVAFAKFLCLYKPKFIAIERGVGFANFAVKKLKFMRFIYARFNTVLGVSKAVVDEMQKTLDLKNLQLFYDTIQDVTELKNQALETDERYFNKDVVLNVGRLAKHKRQDLLIRAFLPLKDKYSLLIIGAGEEQKNLEALINELGLNSCVFLLGHKDNPYKYMSKAKVFALTSLSEGFGKVVLEAMACGTAVVAINSQGGHNELLSNNAGVLVDQNELSLAILKLLQDDEFRTKINKNAQEKIKYFSAQNHIERFLKISKGLITNA